MHSQRWWQIWRSSYFWLGVVAVLALPLLADFNVRLAYNRQLAAEEAKLQQQIVAEQSRQTALHELESYVKSEAYVEDWARRARLAKSGEVPVVPVPLELDRESDVTPPTTSSAPDLQSEWWRVLFDRVSLP
jgi:hypothetical protein